ncbi:hypothetical protein [uncultured Sphaerochaeta sp.]|uniref:hypothetical protein n=1 Tax=uncultured Sphaerochaeta sp. TaxID=886478 RepID=UPI002A0A33DE|nr:hypothetical protein [uncultured Sphaerochaeta sp.]
MIPDFSTLPMANSAKPYVRWWWFSGALDYKEIETQLSWLVSNGFGGVEIAWVYPYPEAGKEHGPKFLDEDFQAYVQFTLKQCKEKGLGCDLTFGTLWPFSGTFIPKKYTSKARDGFSTQRVNRSWEASYTHTNARILDHLDTRAFQWYSDYLSEHGFVDFVKTEPMALFCDSWEVEPEDISYETFQRDFVSTYGYVYDFSTKDINERYDYRSLISERVLSDFYRPYAQNCKEMGAFSRVQCHGAPTDILAAYAYVDIPETETLLFNPDFALIAASAAALEHKPIVSSESFTCLYGWVPSPAEPPHIKQEHIDDLRCVADAQFAWGVNRVVWHGMPYNTKEKPRQFYATLHVGPDGSIASQLPQFNAYLEEVSEILTRGETFSNISILLPLEDQWMRDELPPHLQKPSSKYWWELQELTIPLPLMQYRPLWFSPHWIDDLSYQDGQLLYKQKHIGALYCMNEYMSFSSLKTLAGLCAKGAPIYFSRLPKEPGTQKHRAYNQYLSIISTTPPAQTSYLRPILKSSTPIDYWCRKDGETYYVFFAHPEMRNLRYPLPYRYAQSIKPCTIEAVFHSENYAYDLCLQFPRSESLLVTINDVSHEVTIRNLHIEDTTIDTHSICD